jgi:hypothetical protein
VKGFGLMFFIDDLANGMGDERQCTGAPMIRYDRASRNGG